MTRVIDAWSQQPNELFMRQPWLRPLLRWTRQRPAGPARRCHAEDDGRRRCREVAVVRVGRPHGTLIDNDETAAHVRAHPDRFAGVASVDLTRPVDAVRELRRAVTDLGMVALRVVPWLWNLPPNDRRYYPLLQACVELGIPFCTQIGHTGPLCPPSPAGPSLPGDGPARIPGTRGHRRSRRRTVDRRSAVPGQEVSELLHRHLGLRHASPTAGAGGLHARIRPHPSTFRNELADAVRATVSRAAR